MGSNVALIAFAVTLTLLWIGAVADSDGETYEDCSQCPLEGFCIWDEGECTRKGKRHE